MAAQSYFDKYPQAKAYRQPSNKGASYYGTPDSAYVPEKEQPKPKPVAKKPKQPEPPKPSLLSKIGKTSKNFAKDMVAGENAAAKTIARVLPGGTADLDASQKQAEQAVKDATFINSRVKAGRMTKEQASKLYKNVNQSSGQASKSQTEIAKNMPTKTQAALGFASTGADILTAGTFRLGKAGYVGGKAAVTALRPVIKAAGKKRLAAEAAEVVGGSAIAGGLNAGAAGGSREDMIKAAAAGALFPIALKGAGTVGGKAFDKVASKTGSSKKLLEQQKIQTLFNNVKKQDAKGTTKPIKPTDPDLPPSAPTQPQPGDVIKPTPLEMTKQKAIEDTLSKIKNPKADAENAQIQAKQAEADVANQKIEVDNQKIDDKIELIEAKENKTKVDTVKIKQLKAQKQPINTDGGVVTTPETQLSNEVTPTSAVPATGIDENGVPLANNTPQINAVAGALPDEVKPDAIPGMPGSKTVFDTPEIIAKREEQALIPSSHEDMSPERMELRKQVSQTLYQQGGHADANKAPEKILANRRADIVLGAPASGKTNIVDPLLNNHQSRLIDSDEAKGLLGDVNQAGALHQESDQIIQTQLVRAMKRGDNVVYPLVGKNAQKIEDIVLTLKEQGYDVNVHYNHLDPDKAAGRAVSRFNETGRFVDPDYVVNQIGLKPKATYDIIKGNENITEYTHYDNDVAYGEKPKLIESGRVQSGPDSAGRLQRERNGGSPEKSVSEASQAKQVDTPATLTPLQTANMEPINGYTHSTDLIKDYADYLRGREKTFTGGQMIDTTGFKDAVGSGRKRISEHSKFYREFYKENKRAPTKDDYYDLAKNELATGKDEFGAADDYKLLVERESKPIRPIEPVKQTPAEKTAIEAAPKLDGKTPDGKEKASRVYDRLKAEHPELDDNVTYNTINLQKDAEAAVELVAKDKQQAYRIAMGAESLNGQTNTAVNIALAEKALVEGDTKLYATLVTNRSLAQTRRGQELVAEKGSVTDNSTSRYVKDLIAMRLESIGKKDLSDIDLSMKKLSQKQRAVKVIDKEVAKLEKQISSKKLDVKTAMSLLDEMACL